MKLHGALGPATPELSYQRCLARELMLNALAFKQKWPLPVVEHRGVRIACALGADLFRGNITLTLRLISEAHLNTKRLE
jgi:hypothetical protein